MKQLFTALSLVLGIAATADTVIFKDDFESTANWFKNPACETPQFGGGGTLQLVDGRKTGKCLKIVTNSKQMFMLNLRRSLPVKDGSRLRISFLVRGKGAISINPLGRTADKKTVYLELTPQSTKPWYGKEIVFDNEQSFIAEYSKDGCEVIEITDSVVVGEPPEFVLSRMEG